MANQITVDAGGSDIRTVDVRAIGSISQSSIYTITIGQDVYSYTASAGDIFRNVLTAFMQIFTEVGSQVVDFNVNSGGTRLLISEKVGGSGFTVETTENLIPNLPGHIYLISWDRASMTAIVRDGKNGDVDYSISVDSSILDVPAAIIAIKQAVAVAIAADRAAQQFEESKPDLSGFIGLELV